MSGIEELRVDYFDKEYLDFHHPNRENAQMYQLSYGNSYSSERQGFSQRKTFYDCALDLFKFLRKKGSFDTSTLYELKFSSYRKPDQINDKEKRILEEIIALHNDFATPRKRTKK
ncbi:MAG: hypothetical protein ACP5OA_05455 [Candidatus Woesearchaeota archaeon]